MKNAIFGLSVLMLAGCASQPQSTDTATTDLNSSQCVGSVDLPVRLAPYFETVEDEALLNSALGAPEEGKLCQGKVYQSKAGTQVTLYRAWNSTNPYSQFGQWWAYDLPAGKVAKYREDYEICYQWSPLDKLVTCELKAGTKVVIGTGQSAKCSEYLTYDVSESQQVYIENSQDVVANCAVKDGILVWE
ncbi:hypothetical protein [Vibrio nigripulchritudo]|uniref:hypothetical protein n=1 Tax=Vibrio nigripulchritudo TaxID=28173 RepID=UPI0005FA2BF0|nr:hypothetical protein [Vibrio nigripulchritudo]KJY75210.1 hypothetical protein TW74_17905 [Vibrio nigripulchritudo]